MFIFPTNNNKKRHHGSRQQAHLFQTLVPPRSCFAVAYVHTHIFRNYLSLFFETVILPKWPSGKRVYSQVLHKLTSQNKIMHFSILEAFFRIEGKRSTFYFSVPLSLTFHA